MSTHITPSRPTCFELRAAFDELCIRPADFARLCGVKPVQVWRWCEGKAEVPTYVWSLLAMFQYDPLNVLWGERPRWKVTQRHVFRNGKSYKSLARRFHPDATGRDTTAEMQLINEFRPK